MVHVDELLLAVDTFSSRKREIFQNRRWEQLPLARREFRRWCEKHMPGVVEFPEEVEEGE